MYWSITNDVENGAAQKSWKLPMYHHDGYSQGVVIVYDHRVRYDHEIFYDIFFKEFILSQSV